MKEVASYKVVKLAALEISLIALIVSYFINLILNMDQTEVNLPHKVTKPR